MSNETESLNTPRKSEIQDILDLLQSGDKKIEYATHQDVMLLLGNTGAGKSTFTQFMAGDNNNLESVEILPGLGDYYIKDISGKKISGTATITSHTIFPELVLDTEANVAFYDCPGFSDTRSAAHDIAATYFTKKVIDSAKSIKLVFIVNYSAVKTSNDRLDFMLLVKHAVKMIKNIDKFKDSIALIVTKVDPYKKNKIVPDEIIIRSIAQFLKGARDELKTNQKFNKNEIKFIDIFLAKEGEYYTKIGILKTPDDAGLLSNISLMQNCKKPIKKILHENLQFCVQDEVDFGFTISAASKNDVHTLEEKINENVASEIVNLGREIEKHYLSQEKELHDIQELCNMFKLGYDYFSATKKEAGRVIELQDLIRQITKNINDLKISVPRKNLLHIENYDQYLTFLKPFSGLTTAKPLGWAQGLTDVIEYLNNSQKWYDFLIRLHEILSKYDVQQNVNQYADVTNDLKFQITATIYEKEQIAKNLKQFLDGVSGKSSEKEYSNIKDVELDKIKLNFLYKTLDTTLKFNLSFPCNGQKLIMKGHNIKLSDIAKVSCPEIKFIEIFALNKVFIDTNFNKTGKKVSLSIIAPTWEIIGGPQIILDGEPGRAHDPAKAQDGMGPGSSGQVGNPGYPGGVAGNFFGIGKTFIGSQHLKITANGGKGGAGQAGGDGIDGENGESPEKPEDEDGTGTAILKRSKFRFYMTKYEDLGGGDDRGYYEIYGTSGQEGGNGGNGGVGGKGGNSGDINIIGLHRSPDILVQNVKGSNGKDGLGGKRGNGGRSGDTLFVSYTERFKHFSKNELDWHVLYRAAGNTFPSGNVGVTGYNARGMEYPEEPIPNINIFRTTNKYKNYIRENLNGNIRESYYREFINQL